jgi:hypothetical protein
LCARQRSDGQITPSVRTPDRVWIDVATLAESGTQLVLGLAVATGEMW